MTYNYIHKAATLLYLALFNLNGYFAHVFHVVAIVVVAVVVIGCGYYGWSVVVVVVVVGRRCCCSCCGCGGACGGWRWRQRAVGGAGGVVGAG